MIKVLIGLTLFLALGGLDQVRPEVKDSTGRFVTAPDSVVYITKDGKKYHLDGCQYLSKSKLTVSLAEARENGYEACKRCYPDSERK